jgi:DNA repair protein RecN (Recombination protein N)
MLVHLHIRNLALIEAADVELHPGLNVISGETGGGKSLVVAALELLRGEKASKDLVRQGAGDLRVDGEFALGDGPRARAVLELLRELLGEAPVEDGVLVVSRIVDAEGKSRARIAGRPASLSALRALGAWLIEIHGQGDSRGLMRPEIQCETLDTFAGCAELRHAFGAALAQAREAERRLREVAGSERDRRHRVEFLRYQLDELDALDLAEGEVARLEEEHRLLAHLDRQRELLTAALADLADGESNAAELVARGARRLDDAAVIDRALAPAAEQLRDADVLLTEVARAVRSGLSRLDLDPARLAEVDERLTRVRRMLDRFGPSEAEVFAQRDAFRRELDRLTDAAAQPDALAAELARRTEALADAGHKLARVRRKAAPAFAAAVVRELAGLGMPHTKLQVVMPEVDDARLLAVATAHGPAPVDFAVSVNPGEAFHSMRETGSGGELARLVLAVKKTLADQDRVPFLVFDEVDAEIGGRLGLAVGRKLREVAAAHQVLIVTHLPQVAAFAQRHIKVAKEVAGERTRSRIAQLGVEESAAELAAMASGDDADAAALIEARRLVARARDAVQGG